MDTDDDIVFALLKSNVAKVTFIDKLKARFINMLLPKQIFIGNRKQFRILKEKYEIK